MARALYMAALAQAFVARVLLITGGVGLAMAGDSRNQEPARLTPRDLHAPPGIFHSGLVHRTADLRRTRADGGVGCSVRERQHQRRLL